MGPAGDVFAQNSRGPGATCLWGQFAWWMKGFSLFLQDALMGRSWEGGEKTFAGEHRAQLLDETDRETRGRWEEKKVRRGKKSITRSPGGVYSRQQHRREPHMVLVGVAGPLSAGLSQPLLLAAAYLSASFFSCSSQGLSHTFN